MTKPKIALFVSLLTLAGVVGSIFTRNASANPGRYYIGPITVPENPIARAARQREADQREQEQCRTQAPRRVVCHGQTYIPTEKSNRNNILRPTFRNGRQTGVALIEFNVQSVNCQGPERTASVQVVERFVAASENTPVSARELENARIVSQKNYVFPYFFSSRFSNNNHFRLTGWSPSLMERELAITEFSRPPEVTLGVSSAHRSAHRNWTTVLNLNLDVAPTPFKRPTPGHFTKDGQSIDYWPIDQEKTDPMLRFARLQCRYFD